MTFEQLLATVRVNPDDNSSPLLKHHASHADKDTQDATRQAANGHTYCILWGSKWMPAGGKWRKQIFVAKLYTPPVGGQTPDDAEIWKLYEYFIGHLAQKVTTAPLGGYLAHFTPDYDAWQPPDYDKLTKGLIASVSYSQLFQLP
jgi:hypothetical protein